MKKRANLGPRFNARHRTLSPPPLLSHGRLSLRALIQQDVGIGTLCRQDKAFSFRIQIQVYSAARIRRQSVLKSAPSGQHWKAVRVKTRSNIRRDPDPNLEKQEPREAFRFRLLQRLSGFRKTGCAASNSRKYFNVKTRPTRFFLVT